MVDRTARSATSELLRHLLAGLITNDEFEDRLPRNSNDLAVREVQASAWLLYDDLREYRLTGKDRATADVRSAVSRWILFLGTDLEYEYPVRSGIGRAIFVAANILTVGTVSWAWRRRHHDELLRWPFFRVTDLEAARRTPRLLAGRA